MSTIIDAFEITYTYLLGSKQEHNALKDITLTLDSGEFLGIFGPNGSGKSTLSMHFNGLLSPTEGSVTVCGIGEADRENWDKLWEKAGMVFQYPERQIFEASVFDEIAYGLKNLGLNPAEIKSRVESSLRQVGLDPEEFYSLQPLSLSGGMRRRVAIASVLALRPQILILDEPMAGLDPIGRKYMLNIIRERKRHSNDTTVMISHCLKDILMLADKIAVLDEGKLIFFGSVDELLANHALLALYHFELPEYLKVVTMLREKGVAIKPDVRSIEEAGAEIVRVLQEVRNEEKPTG